VSAFSPSPRSKPGTGLRVLVVDDDHAAAREVETAVRAIAGEGVELELLASLAPALERLTDGGVDLVLLDLHLPDSTGLETLDRARAADPEVAIVVLASPGDEEDAPRALGRGAQDYLVKARLDSDLLARIVHRAAVRQQLEEDLRALLVLDDLTGLYNRRGFATIGLHLLKAAARDRRPAVLVRLELNELAASDAGPRRDDDRRLFAAAQILRETFRESDVIARLGGGEFAVLLAGDRAAGEAALARLERAVAAYARATGGARAVSLAAGVATYDPELPSPLDDLLELAERRLAEERSP